MGVNYPDYDFKGAVKPCGTGEFGTKPSGKCIKNAKRNCNLYPMCNLKEKTPWKKPTQPQEFTRPRKQAYVKVHLSRSRFFEKQKEIIEK